MRSWLIALRIARREARRSKGRTALIVAMIAVPIVALSFAAATYDMYKLTPSETLTRQMGTASAQMSWTSDDPVDATVTPKVAPPSHPHTPESLLSHLPAGSRVIPYWQSAIIVKTAGGIGDFTTYGYDTTDPLTRGMTRIVSGRAPQAADEVDVSAAALARLGLRVGDSVTYANEAQPSGYRFDSYRIVGTVEIGGQLREYLLFRPDQRPDERSWLVSTPGPVTEPIARSLGTIGIDVTSRALLLHPPADMPSQMTSDPTVAGFSYFGIGTLIIGLGLLEVVLLAGPAFAVGARRRQHDLALVETAGGTSSTLRRIVLADGIVGGVLAAVSGLIVGLALAAVVRPVLEVHLVHARFGAYRVSPVLLLTTAGLAVITGLIGALVPAITAGRQDVVSALTGRRGVARSRTLWVLIGVAGVALGAVLAFAGAYRHDSSVVLAGLVTGELGMVLCTPKLVGFVARIGRFLPVAPRIALRDTARRRAAAAPAISAVMAAVAGSVALTVYLGASNNRVQAYQQQLPLGSVYVQVMPVSMTDGTTKLTAAQLADHARQSSAALAKIMPGSDPITVTATNYQDWTVQPTLPVGLQCPYHPGPPLSAAVQRRAAADKRCTPAAMGAMNYSPMPPVVTDDPSVVAAVLGLSGPALRDAVAALGQGRALVTDAQYISHGQLTLVITANDGSGTPRSVTVPAVTAGSTSLMATVLPPGDVAEVGVPTTIFGVVATPTARTSEAQKDAIQAQATNNGVDYAYEESGPPHDNVDIALILAIAAAVIALGAAAIATGLASVDGRNDLRTLGAIGATPRVRRVLALAQSGVIAGLGSLLGAAAGLGAGAAVLFGLNQVYAGKWPAPMPYPIPIPWLNLGVSVLVVPLVAMLGAGLLTRSRLPSERRAD